MGFSDPVMSVPLFACKDIGMNCSFRTEAPTEAELLKKIAEHAKTAHNLDSVPPDVMAKIRKAIRK
jgi:predicted small metal-binding protein